MKNETAESDRGFRRLDCPSSRLRRVGVCGGLIRTPVGALSINFHRKRLLHYRFVRRLIIVLILRPHRDRVLAWRHVVECDVVIELA